MYTRIKKVLTDPFFFAIYMLIISYLGAPVILKVHLGPFRKIGLVWGAILLAVFLFKNYKVFINNKYAAALLLFCFVNGITILVNWRVKLSSNIFTFGYMVTSLLLVFNVFYNIEKSEAEKKVLLFCRINIILPFIYAVIALFTFVFCINGVYEAKNGYQYYGMYNNRLWGLFNPNTGGTMAAISIAFSIFLLVRGSRKRKFLIFNIIVQYIYMILTQSRSAYIGFLCMVLVFIIFVLTRRENIFVRDAKRVLTSLFKMVTIFAVILLLSPIVRNTVTILPNIMLEIYYSEGESIEEKKVKIERTESFDEEDANSVSNGRFDIWNAGIQIWKRSPVWGAGANSIYEYGKVYLDKGTAQALRNGGLHNVYITTLVASGIVGLGTLIIYLLLVLVRFVRYLFKGKDTSLMILMALCGMILVADMMESRILYANSSVHYVFWTTMGILCHDKSVGALEKNNLAEKKR